MSKLPQHKGGCLAGTASADGITARAVTYDRPVVRTHTHDLGNQPLTGKRVRRTHIYPYRQRPPTCMLKVPFWLLNAI
jgi:hypothetical protein